MNQDKEFLDFITEERMEEHSHGWKESYSDKEMEAYEALLRTLPQEHKEILRNYDDHINDYQFKELKYYYCCGVRDGVRLSQYIQNMLK